jgi:hypothetical protein
MFYCTKYLLAKVADDRIESFVFVLDSIEKSSIVRAQYTSQCPAGSGAVQWFYWAQCRWPAFGILSRDAGIMLLPPRHFPEYCFHYSEKNPPDQKCMTA